MAFKDFIHWVFGWACENQVELPPPPEQDPEPEPVEPELEPEPEPPPAADPREAQDYIHLGRAQMLAKNLEKYVQEYAWTYRNFRYVITKYPKIAFGAGGAARAPIGISMEDLRELCIQLSIAHDGGREMVDWAPDRASRYLGPLSLKNLITGEGTSVAKLLQEHPKHPGRSRVRKSVWKAVKEDADELLEMAREIDKRVFPHDGIKHWADSQPRGSR